MTRTLLSIQDQSKVLSKRIIPERQPRSTRRSDPELVSVQRSRITTCAWRSLYFRSPSSQLSLPSSRHLSSPSREHHRQSTPLSRLKVLVREFTASIMDALVAQYARPAFMDEGNTATSEEELELANSLPPLGLKFSLPPIPQVGFHTANDGRSDWY